MGLYSYQRCTVPFSWDNYFLESGLVFFIFVCLFVFYLESWLNSQEDLKTLSLEKALSNKPNKNFSV